LAITLRDDTTMPSLSVHDSIHRPGKTLIALAVLFSLAACQPQSRAAADDGAAASGGNAVTQSPAPVPTPAPLPAPTPDAPPAPASGTVVLGYGDEATVAPGTQLRFLRVVNDSRCPKDVQCVWAGEVTIEFELKSTSGKSRFQLASARAPSTAAGTLQFELKDYGACPAGSNRLADAECATVAITTAATR
jgi:hypothetical protein